MAFLVPRLLLAAATLLVLSVGVFALFGVTPGRGADDLEAEGAISSVVRQRLNEDDGASWPARYGTWVTRAATGNFGDSRTYGRAVLPLILERAGFTLALALPGIVLAWCIALPLGAWAAAYHRKAQDNLVLAATSFAAAVPDLVVAFFILWGAARFGVLRTVASTGETGQSLVSEAGVLWSAMRLPLAVVVVAQVPLLVRTVRITALSVAEQAFVRHVRARGVSLAGVMGRHVLRAAAGPLLTLAGSSFAAAISGALVAETVFSWPGVGALALGAARSRDEALVAGIVMTVGAWTIAANLLADGAAWLADPRRSGRG